MTYRGGKPKMLDKVRPGDRLVSVDGRVVAVLRCFTVRHIPKVEVRWASGLVTREYEDMFPYFEPTFRRRTR